MLKAFKRSSHQVTNDPWIAHAAIIILLYMHRVYCTYVIIERNYLFIASETRLVMLSPNCMHIANTILEISCQSFYSSCPLYNMCYVWWCIHHSNVLMQSHYSQRCVHHSETKEQHTAIHTQYKSVSLWFLFYIVHSMQFMSQCNNNNIMNWTGRLIYLFIFLFVCALFLFWSSAHHTHTRTRTQMDCVLKHR